MLGDAPLKRCPDLLQDLFPSKEGLPRRGDHPRELVVLGGSKLKGKSRILTTSIPLSGTNLPTLVDMLAAFVAGRRLRGDLKRVNPKLAKLGERLRGAAFPTSSIQPPTSTSQRCTSCLAWCVVF